MTGIEQNREARMDMSGPDALVFSGKDFNLAVPYERIQSIEYGQKAGRRVGAAIGTAVALGPLGLAMLALKKRESGEAKAKIGR